MQFLTMSNAHPRDIRAYLLESRRTAIHIAVPLSSGCQVRILSIDFSIPYLLKDENYPIGGWAVQLSIWLRALENAGHEAALLTWKGALAHVGSGQQIKLIETYDPAQGVRVAKYFYSYIPKILAAARAYRPDIMIQGASGVHTAIMAFVAGQLGIPFVHRIVSDINVDERCKIGLRSYEWLAYSWARHRTAAFLCQNEYQREKLAALFPGKPIHVIHNAVVVAEDAPAPLPRAERDMSPGLVSSAMERTCHCFFESPRNFRPSNFAWQGCQSEMLINRRWTP